MRLQKSVFHTMATCMPAYVRRDRPTSITPPAAAEHGAGQMKDLTSGERSRILANLAGEIRNHTGLLIDTMVMEGGKTRKFAATEVSRAELTIRIASEEAKRIYGEIVPLDWSDETRGCFGCLRRFPVGPVLGIVPFNFPLNLACHKLGPAVAAGNPFILKPASATPVSALLLGDLCLKAGIPPDAISVTPCPGNRAEAARQGPEDQVRILHRKLRRRLAPAGNCREKKGRP